MKFRYKRNFLKSMFAAALFIGFISAGFPFYERYREDLIRQDLTYSIEQSENRAFPVTEPVWGEGIGILKIPKIQAELPVVKGASNEFLKTSECWIAQTADIGSAGNAVIAGHRSYTYGRHFNRLDELGIGDEIHYIQAGGNEMLFVVNEILVKDPGDPAVFSKPEEDDISLLTLYTCTPVRIASQRLIVRALRIK